MTSDGKKCESGLCIQVDIYYGEHLAEPVVRVHSTETATMMQARITEWIKFVREVRLGDWDHIETDYEILIAKAEQAKIVNEFDPTQPQHHDLNEVVDVAEHKAR